jgi:hypothetical protein
MEEGSLKFLLLSAAHQNAVSAEIYKFVLQHEYEH